MSKKMNETTKTATELEADLKVLKKQISEKRREEVLAPFIPMILDCQKVGKLEELKDACFNVVYVENVLKISEQITAVAPAIIDDEDEGETDIEALEE